MNAYLESVLPRSRWLIGILVVGLVGYPVFGTVVALSQLPSLAASIPVRLFIALASIGIILGTRSSSPSLKTLVLRLFWAVYLARLVWDTVFTDIEGADEALLFFSTTCLLPAAALLRARSSDFNEIAIARLILWFGLVACILAVVPTLGGFAGPRSILAETGRLGFDNVNPITFGHVATSTVIGAIALWHRKRVGGGGALLLLALFFSAATLQLSGSRGPAVSLAACLFFAGIYNRNMRPILIVIVVGISGLMIGGGGALEDRFGNVEGDPSTLERLLVQSNAIRQFMDSPIVGSAYIERELHIYPHNPFIEAAMATGIIGLIMFALIFLVVFTSIVSLLGRGYLLIPLLTLQYVIASMVSGSLYLSAPMWMLFSIVIVCAKDATH